MHYGYCLSEKRMPGRWGFGQTVSMSIPRYGNWDFFYPPTMIRLRGVRTVSYSDYKTRGVLQLATFDNKYASMPFNADFDGDKLNVIGANRYLKRNETTFANMCKSDKLVIIKTNKKNHILTSKLQNNRFHSRRNFHQKNYR